MLSKRRKALSNRCQYVKDHECPDGKFFWPGCMGGAVYGMKGCSCGTRMRRKELEDEVRDLKSRISELEKAR